MQKKKKRLRNMLKLFVFNVKTKRESYLVAHRNIWLSQCTVKPSKGGNVNTNTRQLPKKYIPSRNGEQFCTGKTWPTQMFAQGSPKQPVQGFTVL